MSTSSSKALRMPFLQTKLTLTKNIYFSSRFYSISARIKHVASLQRSNKQSSHFNLDHFPKKSEFDDLQKKKPCPKESTTSLVSLEYLKRPKSRMSDSFFLPISSQKMSQQWNADAIHPTIPIKSITQECQLSKDWVPFEQPQDGRCLKFAIVGAANAGKSTLLNQLIEEKVSIVSPKAHTTRELIKAALTDENKQAVFFDTPGTVIDHTRERLSKELVTSSWEALANADHILLIVDSIRLLRHLKKKHHTIEESLLRQIVKRNINTPATVVFNKVDLLTKEIMKELEIKSLEDAFSLLKNHINNEYPHCGKHFKMSALKPEDVSTFRNYLMQLDFPLGPFLCPPSLPTKSTRSDLKRVEDAIREGLYCRLNGYLPYILKQETIGWTPVYFDSGLRIHHVLYVERDCQKKIVVGAGGKVLKAVIQDATEFLQNYFGKIVELYITVKVRK